MVQTHLMTRHTFRLWLASLAVMTLMFTGATVPSLSSEPSADALMQQGLQAYQHGAFDQALAAWKQAAALYERSDLVKERSRALVQAAQASEALGRVAQALQQLELALALSQQAKDESWTAVVLANLGRTFLTARQPDSATEHLTHALEMAEAQRNAHLAAAVRHDLGLASIAQHRDAEALASFTASAQGALAVNDRPLAVRAQIHAARASLRLNQPAAARDWLDRAMDNLKDAPPTHDKATGLIRLGLAYQQLLPAMPAVRNPLLLRTAGLFVEAAAAAERTGDARTGSYADGYLGRLYETERRYDEALHLTRRALFSAQAADAPESLYRWQWQLGRLLAATGRLDDAIASYRQAMSTLQPIRQEVALANADGSLSDQEAVRPLFFELADLLLQRASLTADAKASEGYGFAARDAIEAYKAAELRDYFKDECVDALQARITKFDTIATDTAVLYPILFPKRLELLVSLPSGLTRVTVPVDAATVTKEIRAFRRLVEKRTTREYLPHAQQLYDWLIRPVAADLKRANIATLVFVPDSSLRTIPVAALHDGANFLIASYAVATTPGITLTDPRPLDREKVRFFASGLTKSVQGFPALPYVAEELDSLRSLYTGRQLMNQDFLAANVEQELRDGRYGIVHIATHGKFSTDVNDSFLLTFDGKLTMGELDRLIGLFRFRDDPLELLTLSACQTGVGDDRAALGLAGIAIKAGARSALATLWFINDEASAALIGEFYRQLRNPAISKAVALQRAQAKLLEDRVYEHPAYWSPFLLLNNWL